MSAYGSDYEEHCLIVATVSHILPDKRAPVDAFAYAISWSAPQNLCDVSACVSCLQWWDNTFTVCEGALAACRESKAA